MENNTVNKAAVLEYIKAQIGLDLQLCDYFTDVKEHNGHPYFNVILSDRVSECTSQLRALEQLAAKSSIIHDIQPNGVSRIAIVCK